MAVDRGIAEAILIGRRKEIVRVLDEMGKDAGDFRIIEEEDDRAAADKAVELVHRGEADMPMKGLMHTSTFMKAILDKEKGLKEGWQSAQPGVRFRDPREGSVPHHLRLRRKH